MPSEDRTARVLAALAPARSAYRSALAATLDEVTALLASARGEARGSDRAAAELGSFAAGRIDADRFAALFTPGPTLDSVAERALERARAVLADLLARHDSLLHVRVEDDGDLCGSVAAALAEAGRAFGAARAAELARGGRFRAADHAALFEPLAFRQWSRQERRLAPPLVVEVDGSDLAPAGLAAFLDGTQKIVLLVRGAAPPAALVRLVTPDVFVAQAADVAVLDALGTHDGPGVAALLGGDDVALFVHEPGHGALAERLRVERLPEREPRGGSPRSSAFQRAQELRLLREMHELAQRSVRTAAVEDAGRAAQPVDVPPVERLASWLLQEAQLTEPRS